MDAHRAFANLRRLGYIAVCTRPDEDNAGIVYENNIPNEPYKKRSPGLPQYHMVVKSTSKRFPTAQELSEITQTQYQISAILGVSEYGSTAFLKVRPFSIPYTL
ncbi:hypothetical protein GGH96_000400 [Coemansia sp. RSA 1972]|nr:hypothetical protein GGH96_000400 [Coemansia sp. RSA 1972]